MQTRPVCREWMCFGLGYLGDQMPIHALAKAEYAGASDAMRYGHACR